MNIKNDFKTILEGLDADYLHDFIATEVKDQYLENCKNGGFSGWANRVMLTKEGKLYLSGSMASNSMNMEEYNGEEIELFRIQSNPELDFELNTDSIEYNLTEEQQRTLYNRVCRDENLSDEEKEEYTDLIDLVNDSRYNYAVELALIDEYNEVWTEILEEYAEIDFQYTILDNYMEIINENLCYLDI